MTALVYREIDLPLEGDPLHHTDLYPFGEDAYQAPPSQANRVKTNEESSLNQTCTRLVSQNIGMNSKRQDTAGEESASIPTTSTRLIRP